MRSYFTDDVRHCLIVIKNSCAFHIFLDNDESDNGWCIFFAKRYYIPTSRQLRRIESTIRSPIFAHFGETITGCSTIRVFRQQQRLTEHSEQLVDHNLVFQFATSMKNELLTVFMLPRIFIKCKDRAKGLAVSHVAAAATALCVTDRDRRWA